MVCTSAPMMPPNTPARPRASKSMEKPGASAQASVASANSAKQMSSMRLRSKRSTKVAASTPEIAALKL